MNYKVVKTRMSVSESIKMVIDREDKEFKQMSSSELMRKSAFSHHRKSVLKRIADIGGEFNKDLEETLIYVFYDEIEVFADYRGGGFSVDEAIMIQRISSIALIIEYSKLSEETLEFIIRESVKINKKLENASYYLSGTYIGIVGSIVDKITKDARERLVEIPRGAVSRMFRRVTGQYA